MDKTTRKTLLYRGGFENTEYCLNHVEGCSHGCRYPCYAYLIKKGSGKIKDYKEWVRPKLVENALELLDVEMIKHSGRISRVFMCFATDLFMQGYPDVWDMSLRIIDKLNASGIPVTTLTKGIYPKELADRKMGAGKDNYFGVTTVSLDKVFKIKYEPGAAFAEARLSGLKYLKDKGFKTWVSMEPYPPPSFVRQNVKDILEAISFVDEVAVGKLSYNKYIYEETKDLKGFYKEIYSKIRDFCRQNNINYFVPKTDRQESIKASTQLLLDLEIK